LPFNPIRQLDYATQNPLIFQCALKLLPTH
jgi:hypothetical protein